MITKWKAFNFKSVRQETELSIAPLTIFAGANSSGKSTFLQSILLVAQTLSHKVSSRSVVLNGALARLGQFDDLRSVESVADQIVVGWTCEPVKDPRVRRAPALRKRLFSYRQTGNELSSVSCEFAFDTEESGPQKEITQIQPRLFSTQLSAKTRDSDGVDRRFFINVRRSSTTSETSKQKWLDASDSDDASARASLQYDVELDDDSLDDIRDDFASAEPVGCLFGHFLPLLLSLGVDVVAEDVRAILDVLIGDGAPRHHYMGREIAVPTAVIDFILSNVGSEDNNVQKTLSEKLHKESTLLGAHSDENGHLFRRKAASDSDPKRPLLPRLDLGGVIDTVG